MENRGEIIIHGTALSWYLRGILGYFFKWNQYSIARAIPKNNGFDLIIGTTREKKCIFCVSRENILEIICNYIDDNINVLEYELSSYSKKDRAIHSNRTKERNKHYHLELKDLTPDHDLYYSDLITTRMKNVIHRIKKHTLREISEITRYDFLQIPNSGVATANQAESLLLHVGLNWRSK